MKESDSMDDAVAAPSLIRPSASTQWKTAQYRFCHCTSMLSSPRVVVAALSCQFSLKEYSMANSWLFTSPSCCEVETKTFSRTYVPAPIRLLFNVSQHLTRGYQSPTLWRGIGEDRWQYSRRRFVTLGTGATLSPRWSARWWFYRT